MNSIKDDGPRTRLRVRIFVDFWNFQLGMKRQDQEFRIDWSRLGPLLAKEAGRLVDPEGPAHYEAMHVYGSHDPLKNETSFKHWFTNRLDRMPGVHAVLLDRQKKRNHPKCPSCQHDAIKCTACGSDMRGTEEKGVDTRIVTDMISLAWVNAYDVAVLVSSDRDFVPVAEFLQTKGIKVIHGCLPKIGRHLSQKCWASLEMVPLKEHFRQDAAKS
jgi:hypothetical protein